MSGVSETSWREILFLFCQNKDVDFYFFQETHALETDLLHWRSQGGKDMWFFYGNNWPAGVAVLLGKFKGHAINHLTSTNGRQRIRSVNC